MRLQDLDGNFNGYTPITFAVNAGKPVWVLGLSEGIWFNDKYGDVPITKADLRTMLDNFKNGAYPAGAQELPIDYEHLSVKADRKPGDGIAAGWIKDLELRNDGRELWVLADWTDAGREKIQKKEYKGFSPFFTPNKKISGDRSIGPTVMGGALTNYQTIPDCVLTCSNEETIAVRKPAHKPFEGPTMKLKNDKGEEVEIPVTSLAGLTLDALADVSPAVKELRAKLPGDDKKIVDAKEFDTMQTTITTLSASVDALKTESASSKKIADDANAKLLTNEITGIVDGLMREGRALPAEKEELIELAQSNRALFDKSVKRRKDAAPLIKLDQQFGGDSANVSGSAVKMFDTLIDEKRKANPKLTWADAMKEAAREKPELASMRNRELSIPVGKGGIPLVN